MMSSASLQYDYGQTETYLEALAGFDWAAEKFVFQTFDDNRDRRSQEAAQARAQGKPGKDFRAVILVGTFEQHKKRLETLNRNGAGVYLTVNPCIGGRKIENLVGYRSVWCEWDNADKEPPEWPLSPHIIVESSPKKFHVYWRVSGLDQNSFWRLNYCLAHDWGGDADAIDATRVLRLPGFYHQKVDRRKGAVFQPQLVHLVLSESPVVEAYSVSEMLAAFRVNEYEAARQAKSQESKKSEPKPASARVPIDADEIKTALHFIPPDDRALWLKIGMALASTRNPAAFELWDEWSQGSAKYDEEDQYRVWASLREQKQSDIANPVTLGTLYKEAKARGYERKTDVWQAQLLKSQKGAIIDCPHNIVLALRNHPEWLSKFAYNEFTGRAECQKREWTDSDNTELMTWLGREMRFPIRSADHVAQSVDLVARDVSYHPIRQWAEGLPQWDQCARLDSMFADFLGAKGGPYTAFAGKSLVTSMIARIYEPGCLVRNVVILEGPEKIGKSTFVRHLGYPWTQEVSASLESKDVLMHLRNCWLGELVELDALSKAAATRIKAFITTTIDHYRPPYGRYAIRQPRITVFVGTTNDAQYLKDTTGNTRFIPVTVAEFNVSAFQAVRDQLFAEALAFYRSHTSDWWMPPDAAFEAEAVIEREMRRAMDPWEPLIEEYCRGRIEVTVDDILADVIDIPKERRGKSEATRAGVILHQFGWRPVGQRTLPTGRRVRIYRAMGPP